MTVAGLVLEIRKRGGRTSFVLDDRSGRLEVTMFEDVYQQYRDAGRRRTRSWWSRAACAWTTSSRTGALQREAHHGRRPGARAVRAAAACCAGRRRRNGDARKLVAAIEQAAARQRAADAARCCALRARRRRGTAAASAPSGRCGRRASSLERLEQLVGATAWSVCAAYGVGTARDRGSTGGRSRLSWAPAAVP